MNKLNELSIIPKKRDANLKALDIALRKGFELFRKVDILANLFDIEKSSDLDLLSRLFRVQYWDEEWTTKEKRKMIKASRDLNKYAGTRWAIKKILSILTTNAFLSEWDKAPLLKMGHGEFRIALTNDKDSSSKRIYGLFKLIDIYKNASSHYALDIAKLLEVNSLVPLAFVSFLVFQKIYGKSVIKSFPISSKIFVKSFVKARSFKKYDFKCN